MEFVSGCFIENVLSILPLASFHHLQIVRTQWGRIARNQFAKREVATVTVYPTTCEVICKKSNFISGKSTRLRVDHPDDYGSAVKLGELTLTNDEELIKRIVYNDLDILNLISLEASIDEKKHWRNAEQSRVRLEGISDARFVDRLKGNFKRVVIDRVTNCEREVHEFLRRVRASGMCSYLTIENTTIAKESSSLIADICDQKQIVIVDVRNCENVKFSVAQLFSFADKWLGNPQVYRNKLIAFRIDDYANVSNTVSKYYRKTLGKGCNELIDHPNSPCKLFLRMLEEPHVELRFI